MKKRIAELTLVAAYAICSSHRECEDCPLNEKWRSSSFCIFDKFNMGLFYGTKKLEKEIEVPAIKIKPSIFAETENSREEEIEPVEISDKLEKEE